MKKNFSSAAEELITGIPSVGNDREPDTAPVTKTAVSGGHLRYAEPRSERMNLLLSKSLSQKLAAEAKRRKMSKNALVNDILEGYFSEK